MEIRAAIKFYHLKAKTITQIKAKFNRTLLLQLQQNTDGFQNLNEATLIVKVNSEVDA